MSNRRANGNFFTYSAVEPKNTNPATIAQGAVRRRRILFTRQIHLARVEPFEAEKEFAKKSAFNGRKKSLDSQAVTSNSDAPPLVVSILRGNFSPDGNRGRS
jgi:hypothetical protein